MRIEVWEEGAASVVRPEDRLDILGYLELEEYLAGLLREGRTRLVLDLEDATFICSSALGVISRFWADCARAGGKLVVARPSREARNFLRLGSLDDVVEVYDTVEEAAAAVAAHGAAGSDGEKPGAGG